MIMFLVWILPKQFWEEIINNPLINALAEFGILLQRLLLSYPHKPLKKAIFQIYTYIFSFILFIYCRVLVIGLILLYGFLSAMTRGSSVKCQRQMVFIWLSHTNQIINVSFFPILTFSRVWQLPWSRLAQLGKEHMADATGQQGMLSPPSHI